MLFDERPVVVMGARNRAILLTRLRFVSQLPVGLSVVLSVLMLTEYTILTLVKIPTQMHTIH